MTTKSAIALRREPGPLIRSLVALTLRIGLGLIFLTAGLGKFEARKAGKYPAIIVTQFADTPLRPDLVRLFADVLPYAEVALGALLIAGLLTTLTATLTGILLANLLFGHTIKNHIDMYPGMLTYLLVNAGILWLSPVTSNYLSADGFLFGWFWAPRSEGRYHPEEAAVPRGSKS
ncbi:MAG: DoxX family membrane protein [Singulisphaera sp.]|nr:DoxX family membrane protein [Singulisphaera sp.]